jgi:hypothetical protein
VKFLAALAVWCAVAGTAAAQRPHAPHSSRYGGAFATAASDSLHVEAVWSEQRRIRLLVTEASGDLLPLETLRNIAATVIAGGAESPAALIEIDAHFEARIATLRLPAVISVRFKASSASPEELLQFNFDDYSKPVDDFPRPSPSEVPGTLAGILRALEEDHRAVQTIYAEGVDAGRIFPIEERIRERVLAIEPYLGPLPAERRSQALSAITFVVRSCWLLHISMDNGNEAQLAASVTQLSDALTRIPAAVAGLAP